jgi:hypothetical protein
MEVGYPNYWGSLLIFKHRAPDWDLDKYLNIGEKYLDGYEEEVRQKVYETIQIFSVTEGGIQIGMLAKMIGLDRSNLDKYLKRLISSSLITKGNGFQGKYMAVKDPSTDPLLMVDLFAKDFVLKMLHNQTNLSFGHNQPGDILEKIIFEFSNLIGSYIIYTIIQGTNPDNYERLSPQLQDTLSGKCVSRAITKVIPDLVYRFIDHLEMANVKRPLGSAEFAKQKPMQPNLLFDIETTSSLLRAFSNIYPLLSKEFEKIRSSKGPYTALELYKNRLRMSAEIAEKKQNCKHLYNRAIKTISGIYLKKCSKCDDEQIVKKLDARGKKARSET